MAKMSKVYEGEYLAAKRLYLAGVGIAAIAEQTKIPQGTLQMLIYRGTRRREPWRQLKERADALILQAKALNMEEVKKRLGESKSLVLGKIHEVMIHMTVNMAAGDFDVEMLEKLSAILAKLDNIERLELGKPTQHVLNEKVTYADVRRALDELKVPASTESPSAHDSSSSLSDEAGTKIVH